MKRIIAIVLIFIHLLNMMGIYGLFALLERNTKHFVSRLQQDVYAGSDAITMKIPFSVPYPTYQDNYERVDGKFVHEGEVYRLVKQKFYNDTLFVVCVRDKKGTVIEDALHELTSSMTDRPIDSKSTSKIGLQLAKDFEQTAALVIEPDYWLISTSDPTYYEFPYGAVSFDPPEQPPRA